MKKELTANQKLIESDISRFKNNNLASNLTLGSLVFECLYFLVVYSQNPGNYTKSGGVTYFSGTLQGDYVYNIIYGASIVLNLVILLSVFYASVELKNYNRKFSYLVWVIAVIQLVRIYVFPIRVYNSAIGTIAKSSSLFGIVALLVMIGCLVLSAALLIAAGVFGYTRSLKREKYMKQLESGEIDIEAAYAEEDVPEVVADAQVDAELKEEIKEENNEEAAEVSEDITGGNEDA